VNDADGDVAPAAPHFLARGQLLLSLPSSIKALPLLDTKYAPNISLPSAHK
jgi:hypothetical protein